MSEISKPWRLFRRPIPARVERLPDPAEMGTAFGLEYCLSQGEPDDDAQPMSSRADAPDGLPMRCRGNLAPR